MRVVLFGATGMLGQGVLRECLADGRVEAVLAVGRSPVGRSHPKLREVVLPDLFELDGVAGELAGYDACFFCLGVSSVGMDAREYRRVTYDLTLSVARTLAGISPGSTFVYVSGAGTDAHGRRMWARVKGMTENALLALPLEAYMFRPGYIQPMHGATSGTRLYRLAYVAAVPFYPVLRRLFPSMVTTTEQVARAMLAVAERGADRRVLETADINALG